ncbi:acyltransferase [Pseudomonas sp. D(2018)]|uniref:acyltransferase family protein n=1 Tax=Pseudomonas sp. D(2018) TaxID=2502238 RepID=UPI0010F484BD|nr:acyltransferase [Pseudomonas sp. D(2018)]
MSNGKNIEIEYLRALAVGLTLLSHLPVLLPFHQTFFNSLFSVYMPWTGVDLFFCISGYVVSKAYLDYFDQHRQQGHFGVAAQSFWLRRLYRLLPTAWLWILIPLALSILFNQTGIFGSWFDNLRSFTAVATFSGNLANQYGAILGPNSVYWSLALEEQFYFLFPLFLLLVTSTRWRVIVLLLLITVQFGLDRNPFGTPISAMLTSFRLDAMMWGVLLCLFSRTPLFRQFEPSFLGESAWWRLGLMLVLFYLLGAIPGQMIAVPVAVGLVALVSLALVWIASYQQGYLFCPPLLSKPLEWLGSRSYALYVIHVCAYHFSVELWTRYATAQGLTLDKSFTVELVLTSIVFMVVGSELNYRLVEQPLRRKGAEIARRRLQRFTGERIVAVPSTTETASRGELA